MYMLIFVVFENSIIRYIIVFYRYGSSCVFWLKALGDEGNRGVFAALVLKGLVLLGVSRACRFLFFSHPMLRDFIFRQLDCAETVASSTK